MAKKRFSVEQIIGHLREAEILLSQGMTVGEICRRIGVSEQSYYRWRREYGGLKVDQARKLKELEQENTQLKRAVADLTLDKLILKEAAEPFGCSQSLTSSAEHAWPLRLPDG
jgi:transposase-like protein